MAKKEKEEPKKPAAKPTSKALVDQKGGALMSRPSYIPSGTAGLEEADNQDFTVPRLALCQAMSPQRKRNDPKYIEGLVEGQLFNTLSGEVYGEVLDVVPLYMIKTRMKFKPLSEGGGIECQSFNAIDGGRLCETCAACPHSQFQEDEAPACYLIYSYPSLIVRDGKVTTELIALSFKSASTKVARDFNTKARMRNAPLFAATVRVTPIEDEGAGQQFYNYKLDTMGWVDDQTFKQISEFYNSMNREALKVQAHDDDTESTSEI